MNKPTHLRAFGMDWSITFVEAHQAMSPEYCGKAIHEELSILIQKREKPELERRTLLHEMVHIVDMNTHAKLSEDQVSQIEHGLWTLFRDNPDVMKWIL